MTVTLKHVAEKAGVSMQTISLVMNGKPGVSDKTRKRILKLASSLGYRPNAAAQAIRSGKFGAVGLLKSESLQFSGISLSTLNAIDMKARERGLQLTIGAISDEAMCSEDSMPLMLQSWSVDGFMIAHSRAPETSFELLRRYRIPCLWLNLKRDSNCVHPDDYGSIQQATRHLLDLGHRRIAFLGPLDTDAHYSFGDRQQAFLDTMADAGAKPELYDLMQVFGISRFMDGLAYGFFKELLSRDDCPTAIIYTFGNCTSLMMAAVDLGLDIPRDLSVIAMQDPAVMVPGAGVSHIRDRELSTLFIPTDKLGTRGFDMLAAMLDGAPETPAVVVPFAFQEGETCAAAPSD